MRFLAAQRAVRQLYRTPRAAALEYQKTRTLRGLHKGLIENLSSVARRAALKPVIERANDNRLPEVADGAVGLLRPLEPHREWLVVGRRIAAKKVEHPQRNAQLIRNRKHGRAQRAHREAAGRREKPWANIAAARWSARSLWLKKSNAVIPADMTVRAGESAQIDEVGTAAKQNVLRVDHFTKTGCG